MINIDGFARMFCEADGYLDFGRYGPPSAPLIGEQLKLLSHAADGVPGTIIDLLDQIERARSAVANLIGFSADHIVLQPNTTSGLTHAAQGMSGTILVSATEFPANTYVWQRAAERGSLKVRWMRPADGRVSVEAIRHALDQDVTAVSVSAVDSRTGYRADLAGIREVIGDRLLVVDAIQGMGVVDESWRAADVVVSGGQKWLRAGWATGFLAVSDRALERIDPVLSGWTGVEDPGRFDVLAQPRPDVNRYSLTNQSPVAAGALAFAVECINAVGIDRIEQRIQELVDQVIELVHRRGGKILSPHRSAERAGIIGVAMPEVPPSVLSERLQVAGMTFTPRPDHVRLGVHVSTTENTLLMLSEALAH